ncbi:unnamed protein product [Adineta steineri]|uniref:RING-type domain-containing protein n=1 Tax=Adineta steineri TaxID=433720 RepID=A0A813S1K5_9BILA|nr:unnamed protein product [Adineta steineri]
MATNSTTSSTFENKTSDKSSKNKEELLNEILTCGICLSRMSSPCCLPCAHAFCRTCIINYAENNNNVNTPTEINYIRCPYCKFQLNFSSLKYLESILIINPTLRQLCEVLETSNLNSNQTNGTYNARCHTCCSLEMLKVCKHCYFMLCDKCRRIHLLDVHRESKIQLDILDTRLRLINEKRLQMDKITEEYDKMRQYIKISSKKLIHTIEQQCNQALERLDEQQNFNDETFWIGNGFDNGEKLDFFISLLDIGKNKLSRKNITDRDLMELYDNLQTIPDVNEKLIESMNFKELSLIVDDTFLKKPFIRVYDKDLSTMTKDISEKLTTDNEQTNCIKT